MKFDGVKCDECERVKGDSNHWIVMQVRSGEGEPAIIHLGNEILYTHGGDQRGTLHDLCGSACAL